MVANSFLEDLALVLCVAAATTVVFHALRQPVVVGYLVAGMVVGPYTPGSASSTASRIHGVSELGVILLMFALGLEFSIRRLLRLGPRAAFITAVQVGLMIWLGYVCGRALGMDQPGEHFHRCAAFDLLHHDRGQGVCRAAASARTCANSPWACFCARTWSR